jgi:hypothetical protein
VVLTPTDIRDRELPANPKNGFTNDTMRRKIREKLGESFLRIVSGMRKIKKKLGGNFLVLGFGMRKIKKKLGENFL